MEGEFKAQEKHEGHVRREGRKYLQGNHCFRHPAY